jgi:hypothetical protein
LEDLKARLQAQENVVERLARKIPGFGGYLDREKSRDADKLLRDFLAKSISAEKGRLENLGRDLIKKGQLEWIGETDRLGKVIDKITDKIRHASYGYTGFFDAVKINEAELSRIYEHDASLVSLVSTLGEAITALEAAVESNGELKERVRAVESQIKNLETHLTERDKILSGVN